MTLDTDVDVAVIGGGAAGLMAAETACAAGAVVHVFERTASPGRKILIAGKGGLNLTHGEEAASFRSRYRERADAVGRWLDVLDAEGVRRWASGLGVETFVGSSGRVFPSDMKAAPLLRGWLRRLRASGVVLHVKQRWTGWDQQGNLRFSGPQGECSARARATVLALGGGTWAKLGTDGSWVPTLSERGVAVAPLQASNCGYQYPWSEHFRERHAGDAVKPVAMALVGGDGEAIATQGEFVISEYGIEGSLVYALGARLREQIAADGHAQLLLDLAPGQSTEALAKALQTARGKRSFSEHLRRSIRLSGVRAGLLRELGGNPATATAQELAARIKALPMRVSTARPLDEAISSAGGVRLEALDDGLMLHELPGTFCAGEMLDWDAPTGGYLLTACFASGHIAGTAAARWALTSAT